MLEKLKKHKSVLISCVIGIIAILVISRIFSPPLPILDADAVMETYLEENVQYKNNKELYRKCFAYEAEDLMDQVVNNLDLLMKKVKSTLISSARIDMESEEARDRIGELKDRIIEYFSQRPENQELLGKTIIKYSDVYITNEKQKGKRVKAEITVCYLDVTAVNNRILENSLNAIAIWRMIAEKNYSGKLMDIATGDVSFVLDEFVKEAEITDARDSYTGTVEFVYDKKEKCWKVDRIDDQVMQAYFGIR